MLVRVRLARRGAALTLGWLAALALCAFSACSGDNPPSSAQENAASEPAQQQTAAAAAQPQPQPHRQPEPDPDEQQEQAEAEDAEQQAEPASAAQMQQEQEESQSEPPSAQDQPAQGYGSDDAYGGAPTESQEAAAIAVPPVRQWLVEGVALLPSVPAELDEYGWSAVIEGDVIAVSAPYHDALGEDTGAVFIFERIAGEWIETAYLLPPYPDPQGWFGRWLALGDGRLVIGAPYEDVRLRDGTFVGDAGVAYVYEQINGMWQRTGTLLPETPYAGASFGWSVSIYDNRIAVAAWEDAIDGAEAGSVTIYREQKGLWLPEAVVWPNEPSHRMMFGRDIEMDQGVLAVGAPGDDTLADNAGAVYVYHYYNNDWHFTAKLLSPTGAAGDRLGSQVALQQPWIAAGAYEDDGTVWSGGATYVWKLGSVWELHSRLEPSDLQPGDWFGYSVDIKGSHMVVGAPHRAHPESGTFRSGAAYAFALVENEWVEVGVLGPVDAVEAGARAEFGWATEIDGQTAVVGAWLADAPIGEDAGAAAVYELPADDSPAE